jgi:phage-related protein
VIPYYWNGGNLIYGLVAFVKKTRETPLKEINLARRRLVQLKKGMWR